MAEIETPTLVLYTHPDCAYSAAVKFDYDNRGVAYTEIDISVHPEAIPDLEKLTGGERITPVTVEGDQVTIGLKGIG